MGSISWGKELVPSGRIHELFSSVLRSVRDRDPVCSHSDQYNSPRQGYSARVSRSTCHCVEAGSTEGDCGFYSYIKTHLGPWLSQGPSGIKSYIHGGGRERDLNLLPPHKEQLALCIHPTHPWTPLNQATWPAALLLPAHHSGTCHLSNPSVPMPSPFTHSSLQLAHDKHVLEKPA